MPTCPGDKTEAPACARCALVLGASCCEAGEGERLATLTWADVARLESTGLPRSRFLEAEWLTEVEAAEYERRRPLYAGYFRRSLERLTLQKRAGACVFFARGRGCTLTPAQRPTACQLYPFERWPDGSWSLQVERFDTLEDARRASGEACLAVQEAHELEDVLRAFGVDEAAVEGLGQVLRSEVVAHARRPARGGG